MLLSTFWDHADPRTGQVLDRARADRSVHPQHDIASIAATGFGLAAIAVGASRGWLTEHDAVARVRRRWSSQRQTCRITTAGSITSSTGAAGPASGAAKCRRSTRLFFMAGVLTARQAFQHDDRIVGAARTLYERIDFDWM